MFRIFSFSFRHMIALGLAISVLFCCFTAPPSKGVTRRVPFIETALNLPVLQGREAVHALKRRGLYPSLEQAIDAARYNIDQSGLPELKGTYKANNPAQGYRAQFTPSGIKVMGEKREGRWEFGMKLKGYGYGDETVAVRSGQINAKGNRVEIARSTTNDRKSINAKADRSLITEWYINRKEGIEQGFTIAAPPQRTGSGERLRLVLEVSGELTAKLETGGQTIALMRQDGEEVLRYSKLKAYDAKGRELPAEMSLNGREVRLETDDEGAAYPITIDPLFGQKTKLTASDAVIGDQFSSSVAISGDTIVVGARGDDDACLDAPGCDSGAAYVFVRTGATWTQQQKLTAADAEAGDQFGISVAISGDTIVVGAALDDDACPADPDCNSGSAYVFVRNGTTWTQQQKLTASDPEFFDIFGLSVSISGDTIVVSSRFDDDAGRSSGSAYVFVRNGTTWVQLQKLTANDAAKGDEFSVSLALSADTIIIGADFDDDACVANPNCNSGSAYIFSPFDIVLQDDANPSRVLMWNSATGDYIFSCNGVTVTGTGIVGVKRGTLNLIDFTPQHRVQGVFTPGLKRGSAALQVPPTAFPCTINDSNTAQ